MKKLYVMDKGWEGGVVVIAESKEQAIEFLANHPNGYHRHDNVTEDDIWEEESGVYEFLGDS